MRAAGFKPAASAIPPLRPLGAESIRDPVQSHWAVRKGKLWYEENDGTFIEYMESVSLTSGYTVVQRGDWASWKEGGSIEAICVVRLDEGGWRAYFNENAGLTTIGNFYSDSLDDWATWSARANIGTEHLMSHGTYIRVASLPGGDGISNGS